MANDTSQPASTRNAPRWRRALPYLLFVVALAVFLIWFFSDVQTIRRSINALHSDDSETRNEHLGYLRSHPNKQLVNQSLLEALEDADLAWSVRRMCASELLRRERLPDLERLLKEGELSTRAVALDVFSDKEYFQNTWAPDPTYRVHETLTKWLQDSNDGDRARAIQIAKQLDWRDGLPFIRPLLSRSATGTMNAKQQRHIIEAAASAVQVFEDCESIPALMTLAQGDPEGHVRMRTMQEVHRMVFERDACPGAVSEEDMRKLVVARLADDDRPARMAAMIIYQKQPAWAADSLDTLKKYLGDLDRESAERRLALEVLIAVDEPEFLAALPRWFYDRAPAVRSSAAQAVGKYKSRQNPFVGSLIGTLRNERENKMAFDSAAQQLRDAAGRWRGVPDEVAKKSIGAEGRRAFQQVLNGLFNAGDAQGIERNEFAADWFRWHAERSLEAEDVEAAVALYRAFWKAADKGDVNAAKAALTGDRFKTPKLFEDLRGWIDAQ